MLTIRLQRAGRKNQPVFRIVLAEKHKSATKKVVEQLGIYNPRSKDFNVKEERVKYWITQHVQMSPTVHNLFVTKKLVEGAKVHAWQPRRKPAPATAGVPTEVGTATTPSPEVPAAGGEQVKTEPAAPASESAPVA